MVVAVNTQETPNSVELNPKSSTLEITIPYKKSDKIAYKFDEKEIVIFNASSLNVTLKLKKQEETDIHIDDEADAYIAGYCTTHPNGDHIKSTSFANRTGSHTPIGNDHSEQNKHLPPGTISITFSLALPARAMIFIGILVMIKRKGESEHTMYLFDPQVGNGPRWEDFTPDKNGGIDSGNKFFGHLIPLG